MELGDEAANPGARDDDERPDQHGLQQRSQQCREEERPPWDGRGILHTKLH
jgi:hypothetical protein